LGAGNQNSIPIQDAFYKLFNQNQVVILKYNPVNDYIKPLVEKILQPLIEVNQTNPKTTKNRYPSNINRYMERLKERERERSKKDGEKEPINVIVCSFFV
jgi:hypothetical protein